MTGFVYSDSYLNHITGSGHPESPDRLKAITDHVRNSEYWNSLKCIKPNVVSTNIIRLIHSGSYVNSVSEACENGFPFLDFGDTAICRDSYSVAKLAVGGVVQAVDEIFTGNLDNAFCAVRPPGHHAEAESAMGFCLFNNVAIAARYAQKKYNIEKVLILDWDVHHGNGTQHIFDSDPTVFYLSLHQYPFYPGTGSKNETGTGDGLGTTKNFPLSAGSGDKEYMDIFENILPEIVIQFSPSLIILSAGFDAHYRDPIANMNVSEESFSRMTKIVVKLSREVCEGKLISVLEGGYDLNALVSSVEHHIKALQGNGYVL